jgi:hypothetical protein
MSVMNVAQDSTETNVDHSEYNSNSTFEVGLKEHYSNIHDAYVSDNSAVWRYACTDP